MPSYSEIMALYGFKSKNAAHKLVGRLVAQGMLEKDEQGKLLPKQLALPVKVLGTVEAGFPSPAEEELIDTMSLDEYLIDKREATYLLRVSGDSMIEAGIMPGDMVLVERTTDARDGDIVVAEVDHDWTMKYFRKKGTQVTLIAANKKYPPIVAKDELKIAAVVKAVVRKY
ncbi:repressor LexA [Candidatus Kaiserbacteria bacterium]|nr:repressor LexA [Candidatus Kaiserbacteria bacterium]